MLFEKQYILQRDSFGIDPALLEGEEFAHFMRWNILALEDELHELLAEIDWKPWSDTQGRGDKTSTVLAKEELVDALHFFINLCLAVRMTPEELLEMYLEKRHINAERQRIGYTKAREEGL